ncbi:hypothetical protein ACIBTP_35510 [Streptomyces avidinii]|uniref:hypothetical protein n=1 Tax=Streptomyces avidinii TaxID=1895 RepID=UPI0037B9566B
MNRVRGRLCAATLSLIFLAGASACSSADDGPAGADRPGAESGRGPESWTLPLQAYLPDDKQQKLVADAREALLVKCMSRYGFSYKPAPPLPKFGPKSMTDLRYGIHDEAAVSRYGYKPPVDLAAMRDQERAALDSTLLSPPEEAVMTGQQTGTSAVAGLPEGGCAGEASRAIEGAGEFRSALASQLGNEAYVKAQQDETVKGAFSGWSACMAEKGFQYGKPMDAVDDRQFAAEKPSETEISTAKADLGCREKSRVAETWFAAEVAIQKTLIEENSERLDKAKSDLSLAVKNASKVLGEKG